MITRIQFSILAMLMIASAIDCVKVNVSCYYETICPGCKNQFLTNLDPARQKIGEYMNIELIPFANGRVISGQLSCQHGAKECYGDAVHACMLDMHDFETAYQLIKCMFASKDFLDPEISADKCAQELKKIDFEPVKSCANGQKGKELLIKMHEKTEQLRPKHTSVPWDTINGVQTMYDMVQYICVKHLRDQHVKACEPFE